MLTLRKSFGTLTLALKYLIMYPIKDAVQDDKSTERSMAKNWAVKSGFINWSRYKDAMKLGGDFVAAIIVTVPFTAIIWPSDELLFSTALIKRAACKIVMFSRAVDLVGAIMRRDLVLTTFYEWTERSRYVFSF